jgi:hypothetical protein
MVGHSQEGGCLPATFNSFRLAFMAMRQVKTLHFPGFTPSNDALVLRPIRFLMIWCFAVVYCLYDGVLGV